MTSSEQQPPVPLAEQVASRLLHHRIIVLDTQLDDTIGARLCAQLFLLSAEDSRADINFWINSPGGSVPAMLAIMDTMRVIPNDVSTLAMGLACSAGQFLLTSGTPGKRYSLAHSRILMHQGSAGIGGVAADIALQADDLRFTIDTVLRITAEQTGQPFERIREDSQRDHWYTAQEARDYGFIDNILDSIDEMQPHRQKMGLA
jgi:ATP-dependent Clp protease protease subunit